ncbi:glutathione S-transferase [Diplocarpon rosae]|nr:glutathione S-transferase [Diplocarpon rosae]
MSPIDPAKLGVLTLHHLNNSQSQRILWLLEELAVEYRLEYSIIHYARDPKYQRAPQDLTSIHQLGRSPTIVTPDGRAIVESLTITKYLLTTYDIRRRFASDDWIRDDMLCAFSSSSLFPLATQEMLFDIAVRKTPWPFSYIMKRIKKAHDRFYSDAEFKKDMVFLESELREEAWFNGSELGMSDFVLSWPMDIIAARGYVDMEKEYPRLNAWKMRKDERPAWKSALERGNGYDLDKLG